MRNCDTKNADVGMKIIVSLFSSRQQSAKRERKSLHAGIEKLDLELSIADRLLLPDQLIQPLFGHRTVALVVNVNP
jgi:hypothetical protein